MSTIQKNTLNIDYSGSDELTEELQNASPGDILVTKIKHRVRRNDNGDMTSDVVAVILTDGSTPVTKKGTHKNEGTNIAVTLSDEKEFQEAG